MRCPFGYKVSFRREFPPVIQLSAVSGYCSWEDLWKISIKFLVQSMNAFKLFHLCFIQSNFIKLFCNTLFKWFYTDNCLSPRYKWTFDIIHLSFFLAFILTWCNELQLNAPSKDSVFMCFKLSVFSQHCLSDGQILPFAWIYLEFLFYLFTCCLVFSLLLLILPFSFI